MVNSPLNKRFATEPTPVINWTVLSNTIDVDALRCLIDALATADKAVSLDIEHQLVKSGQLALPLVLEALISGNAKQQAVCSMVLLRWQAIDALSDWADQHPSHAWKAETLLSMMSANQKLTVKKQPSLAVV